MIKSIVVSLTVLAVCVVPAVPPAFAEDAPQLKPFAQGDILFGAHRGGRLWRPESTLKSFKEAAETWPEIMLEGDVHLTKDGVPVLLHDATVDRTTDGTGPLSEMTLDEAKQLDAGYRFTRDNGATYPYRGKGYTLSTLQEVLEALPNHRFMIEMKDEKGIAAPTVKVILETGAIDRVALASFNATLMDEAKALEPRIASCFSAGTLLRLTSALRTDRWDAYTREDDILVLNYHNLARYRITEEDFPRIQAKGIRICLYNINKPDEINALIDLGVDSMLTDVPDIFAQVLATRN